MSNRVKISMGPVVKFPKSSRVEGFDPREFMRGFCPTEEGPNDVFYPAIYGAFADAPTVATDDHDWEPGFTSASPKETIAAFRKRSARAVAKLQGNYTSPATFDYGLVLDNG